MLDPYEALANAVVIQAASDWREAAKAIKTNGAIATVRGIPAVSLKKDTEAFFNSDDFNKFTKLDGKMILARLKKEVGE